MKSVLVASSREAVSRAVEECFRPRYEVDIVHSRDTCCQAFHKKRYEFLFVDVELLGTALSVQEYQAALEPFWQAFPSIQVVVMSSPALIRQAVSAVKAGASDYITYPIDGDELRHVTQTLHESLRMESELDYLRDQFWQSDSLDVIQTRSAKMQAVFAKVRSAAPTRTTILLQGETGTGKGVLAKVIHRHSHRASSQFISVHCGAIPDTLVESELFGHEKGAFTGAVRRKLGSFEIAHKGTVFLDEIGTITLPAQIRLLRVLQDRCFHRVGGEEDIEVDVRIIAATNMDLKEMAGQDRFRTDLYYRLSVFPIEIPPLRERIEDIPLLARSILHRLNQHYAKGIRTVHPLVMESFRQYTWPGNIRELENLIERAYILESSSTLTPESFPSEVLEAVNAATVALDPSLTLAEIRRTAVERIEREYLQELFSIHKGRVKDVAARAGITTRQLHKLATKYGIRKEHFKTGPGRPD